MKTAILFSALFLVPLVVAAEDRPICILEVQPMTPWVYTYSGLACRPQGGTMTWMWLENYLPSQWPWSQQDGTLNAGQLGAYLYPGVPGIPADEFQVRDAVFQDLASIRTRAQGVQSSLAQGAMPQLLEGNWMIVARVSIIRDVDTDAVIGQPQYQWFLPEYALSNTGSSYYPVLGARRWVIRNIWGPMTTQMNMACNLQEIRDSGHVVAEGTGLNFGVHITDGTPMQDEDGRLYKEWTDFGLGDLTAVLAAAAIAQEVVDTTPEPPTPPTPPPTVRGKGGAGYVASKIGGWHGRKGK